MVIDAIGVARTDRSQPRWRAWMRLLPWNTATRRPPARRRCKLRTTGTAPIPVDDQSIRDGGPATVVAEGTARDVRKPIRGKECETAVMSGRTYNDGQNGFRAVGSCEQEPAERRRPGMRRGPWRPRRQKTRPQPEGSSPGRGFCRFAGQRPGCTGARLEVASRPEFAPPIPSDNQIIDVRAVGVPAVKEDSVDARREAALKALMRHITSFTDGRVRLRHEAFKEQAIHAALRQPLELTGQFTAVEFKAATGSVLLRYDAGHLSRDDFLEAAMLLGLFLATC